MILIRKIIVIAFIFENFALISSALSDNVRLHQLCLDCLEISAVDGCNYLPFCPSHSSCDHKVDLNSYSDDFPEPMLVCHDENSITFRWEIIKQEMFYFMEYFDGQSYKYKSTNFTSCNYITINDLLVNENFTIYLYGISLSEKRAYRSNKVMAHTSKSVVEKTPVKNLNYTLSLNENVYTVVVEWRPGADLSCLYEIVWYGKRDPGEYMHRRVNLKKHPSTKFNLTGVDFGEVYYFSILSVDRNGRKESFKKRLKISIPSCVKTFKNLTLCPPNTPKNLTVIQLPSASQNGSLNSGADLKISWSMPKLKPNFYNLTYLSSNGSLDDAFIVSVNISGNQYFAVLKNVKLGDYYQIKLVAHSEGGSSSPAYLIHYPSTNKTSFPSEPTVVENMSEKSNLWIWIAFATTGFIALIVIQHCLKNVILNHLFVKEKIDNNSIKYTANETEDSKWELVESKLFIDKIIGFGAFGIVQKGYYNLEPNKKIEVAVKTLKATPTGDQIAQFYDEIDIMKSVPRHAHIVYLIGVVTKQRPNNPLMLVEYCSGGDLQSYLRKVAFVLTDRNTNQELKEDDTRFFYNKIYDLDTTVAMVNQYVLESKDLLSFARQIVLGMEFLSNLKVIHRDLAARNILISGNHALKISDFGLSRDIYTDNIYKKITGGKLPFKWMAVESLTHLIYTTKSDVWSFGIVLWEIVTLGGNPYPAINTEELVPLLKSGYRMDKPINCSEELYQIMLNCWHMSPSLRPSFKELRDIFDKMLESEMQYISLEDSKKIDQNYYENMKTKQEDSFVERYVLYNGNIA